MIIEADLQSAELRVIALLAREPLLLDIFARDASPHKELARELFGRPIAKTDEEYTFTKSYHYRWCYSHPDKPASPDPGSLRTYRVNVSPAALARYTTVLNRRYPHIVLWKRQQLAELHRTKRVVNAWGRYRDVAWMFATKDEEWVEHVENLALNHPVQTAIGEVMGDAFVRLWDRLMGRYDPQQVQLTLRKRPAVWPAIQCHDALICVCPESAVDEVADALVWAIEQPVTELGGAIVPAELKVGETWGAVRPYMLRQVLPRVA